MKNSTYKADFVNFWPCRPDRFRIQKWCADTKIAVMLKCKGRLNLQNYNLIAGEINKELCPANQTDLWDGNTNF